MLLGYKGASYTRLKKPTIARAALQEYLASLDPARRIHHAIVLADLARIYIQQGGIPEACKLAKEGLFTSLLKEFGVYVLYDPQKYPPMNNIPWQVTLDAVTTLRKERATEGVF